MRQRMILTSVVLTALLGGLAYGLRLPLGVEEVLHAGQDQRPGVDRAEGRRVVAVEPRRPDVEAPVGPGPIDPIVGVEGREQGILRRLQPGQDVERLRELTPVRRGRPGGEEVQDVAPEADAIRGGPLGAAVVPGKGDDASARLGASEARLYFVGLLQSGLQARGTEFSAESLGDLLIVVQYRFLSGIHTQQIVLYGPDGSLYQRFSTEFTAAAGGSGLWERVESRLPVRGTWITQYDLFGAWRVEVYLDGERMPITSGVFVLSSS